MMRRWQRHHTASAHMIAQQSRSASAFSSSNPPGTHRSPRSPRSYGTLRCATVRSGEGPEPLRPRRPPSAGRCMKHAGGRERGVQRLRC